MRARKRLPIALLLASAMTGAGAAPVALLGYRAEAPDVWQSVPPESSMRLAQYRLDGGVEVIVYFFGVGQGGSFEMNVARWTQQFQTTDGGSVTPTLQSTESRGGFPVDTASLSGAYARTIGIDPSVAAQADQTLRAAFVETPQGNLIVQMFGPSEAVAAARAAFDAFVGSIGP